MQQILFSFLVLAAALANSAPAVGQAPQPDMIYGKWCGQKPNTHNLTLSKGHLYVQDAETKRGTRFIVVRYFPDGDGLKVAYFASGTDQQQFARVSLSADKVQLIEHGGTTDPKPTYVRCDPPGPRPDCAAIAAKLKAAQDRSSLIYSPPCGI
jgi:hypothetical protein